MAIKLLSEASHYTNSYGVFRLLVIESNSWEGEHVVLVKGDVNEKDNIPCRIQSHCLPGISLDSSDCDCKSQLDFSLGYINDLNSGIVIYLNQEGRGHGLAIKIKALNNKNNGMDTFSAVTALGLDEDIRNYDVAIEVIDYLSPKSITMLTNNPKKIQSIHESGITISSVVNVPSYVTTRNQRHLKAKIDKGHSIVMGSKSC